MKLLNMVVIILLVLFYLGFVGKSIVLACRKVNPFVLEQGKRDSTGIGNYCSLLF